MPTNDLLNRLGFSENPFGSTNAQSERRLAEYFVEPPYFDAVVGDPSSPQSQIVFAPRGGGKTAQRRMIEDSSRSRGFLCITYDRFDLPPGKGLEHATSHYHLTNVCRLVVLGLLGEFVREPQRVEGLNPYQKALFKHQVGRFLGSMSAQEFRTAMTDLKNFGEKARDLWNRLGGPIGAVLNAVLRVIGLDAVPLPPELAEEGEGRADPVSWHFTRLAEMAQATGFASTYVLVDRVEEGPLAGQNAAAAFKLIGPLLLDLPTLETPGIAFKFFLWDQLRGAWLDRGRPDRVKVFTLDWRIDELEKMLAQRTHVYSDGRVDSFNELLCEPQSDAHRLLTYLAQGSPRDMIRAADRILNAETRMPQPADCLSQGALWQGIDAFAIELAAELFGQASIDDLARVGKPAFTVSDVATEIGINPQSARSKVATWIKKGLVEQKGVFRTPGRRPQHLHAVTDMRVAIAMLPDRRAKDVLGDLVLICPSCSGICISDRPEVQCHGCPVHFDNRVAQSVLEVSTREPWRNVPRGVQRLRESWPDR